MNETEGRFHAADKNKDGKLNQTEYVNFKNPLKTTGDYLLYKLDY